MPAETRKSKSDLAPARFSLAPEGAKRFLAHGSPNHEPNFSLCLNTHAASKGS
jgi:hypothetical protein